MGTYIYKNDPRPCRCGKCGKMCNVHSEEHIYLHLVDWQDTDIDLCKRKLDQGESQYFYFNDYADTLYRVEPVCECWNEQLTGRLPHTILMCDDNIVCAECGAPCQNITESVYAFRCDSPDDEYGQKGLTQEMLSDNVLIITPVENPDDETASVERNCKCTFDEDGTGHMEEGLKIVYSDENLAPSYAKGGAYKFNSMYVVDFDIENDELYIGESYITDEDSAENIWDAENDYLEHHIIDRKPHISSRNPVFMEKMGWRFYLDEKKKKKGFAHAYIATESFERYFEEKDNICDLKLDEGWFNPYIDENKNIVKSPCFVSYIAAPDSKKKMTIEQIEDGYVVKKICSDGGIEGIKETEDLWKKGFVVLNGHDILFKINRTEPFAKITDKTGSVGGIDILKEEDELYVNADCRSVGMKCSVCGTEYESVDDCFLFRRKCVCEHANPIAFVRRNISSKIESLMGDRKYIKNGTLMDPWGDQGAELRSCIDSWFDEYYEANKDHFETPVTWIPVFDDVNGKTYEVVASIGMTDPTCYERKRGGSVDSFCDGYIENEWDDKDTKKRVLFSDENKSIVFHPGIGWNEFIDEDAVMTNAKPEGTMTTIYGKSAILFDDPGDMPEGQQSIKETYGGKYVSCPVIDDHRVMFSLFSNRKHGESAGSGKYDLESCVLGPYTDDGINLGEMIPEMFGEYNYARRDYATEQDREWIGYSYLVETARIDHAFGTAPVILDGDDEDGGNGDDGGDTDNGSDGESGQYNPVNIKGVLSYPLWKLSYERRFTSAQVHSVILDASRNGRR